MLRIVEELCRRGELPVAQVRDLTKRMGKSRGAVAKMLSGLKREGYVENPLWGGWRLTAKGRKLLGSFQKVNPREGGARLEGVFADFDFLFAIREAGRRAREARTHRTPDAESSRYS